MRSEVIIIGAGAAGMLCASEAGRRGRKVLLLDHADRIGGKILISGGGRCNFTNLHAGPGNYVSMNPHFCKSALSRYPSSAFIEKVRAHGIPYHERKHGQLFCDDSARDIVQLLTTECEEAGARFELKCRIEAVRRLPGGSPARFEIATDTETYSCESLVIATGGLSIPKVGATDLGHRIARQFGLKVVDTAPALDGFTLGSAEATLTQGLAGISLAAAISCNGVAFEEALLFTHGGLSGPVSLQASLHWHPGDTIMIDLLPGRDTFSWFLARKREGNRGQVRNLLSELLPARLAERFCESFFPSTLPLPQASERALEELCRRIHAWTFVPAGTVGYSKAEVTRGGVDTDELSSKTMECRKVPGLYFIGEVVDVTGWLGGFNFQWAWSSGWAAGQVV